MELVGSTTDLSYSLPISNPTEDIWVAVSASGNTPNDWKSLRSDAVLYDGGDLLNCSLNIDLSVVSINNTDLDFTPICNPNPVVISAEITNGGVNAESNFIMSYQINSDPVIEEVYTNTLNPGATETFTFTVPVTNLQNGTNVLRVWSNITGDEYLQNDEKVLEFFTFTTSTALDFAEDFESVTTLPTGWTLNNPDNDLTWETQSLNTGSDGNTTQALFINNYIYNGNGELDTFTTEYFDLNYNGTPELNFDLAKAQYSLDFSDGLRVEVSLDCGQTYQEVYFKDGLTLSTIPDYNLSSWQPASSEDWRTEVIDLTPFVGNDILVRFSNINGYGNSTFIDNINLIKNETLSIRENPLFDAVQLFPNPTRNTVNLELNTNYSTTYSLVINNVLGQTLWQSNETDFNQKVIRSIDFSKFSSGTYFITVKVGDAKVVKKLIKI